MSALELRIIIIVIGIIILALIYYFGTRPKKDLVFEEPLIEPSLESNHNQPAKKSNTQKNLKAEESVQAEDPSRKIVTLFLHAKEGQQFDWHMIKSAADSAGLEFAEDKLFYRYREIGDQKDMLFIVANMLKPGYFDMNMRTSGLVLILNLPGFMPALDMWDIMFPVGERMTELLGGKLTDEYHNVFSNQRIASMREEMREFDHQNSMT